MTKQITEPLYQLDVLGSGYEQTTLNFPDDYEGKVTATLVRKKSATTTQKAVLYIHGFIDYFFHKQHIYSIFTIIMHFITKNLLMNL